MTAMTIYLCLFLIQSSCSRSHLHTEHNKVVHWNKRLSKVFHRVYFSVALQVLVLLNTSTCFAQVCPACLWLVGLATPTQCSLNQESAVSFLGLAHLKTTLCGWQAVQIQLITDHSRSPTCGSMFVTTAVRVHISMCDPSTKVYVVFPPCCQQCILCSNSFETVDRSKVTER